MTLFTAYATRAPERCPNHDAPFTSKWLKKICTHRVCKCPYAQCARYECGCEVRAMPDDRQPGADTAKVR